MDIIRVQVISGFIIENSASFKSCQYKCGGHCWWDGGVHLLRWKFPDEGTSPDTINVPRCPWFAASDQWGAKVDLANPIREWFPVGWGPGSVEVVTAILDKG